jgi:hypothetical protein
MAVRADLQKMYNIAMVASQATTKLPIGQLAAGGTVSTGSANITMAATIPAWVVSGMPVFDVTVGFLLGTVSSGAGTTTLVLQANAAHAGSGSADVLQFGFTPSDLAVGETAGRDIQGAIQLCTVKANEIAQICADVAADVITSGQNATLNTLLATTLSGEL